MIVIDFEVFKHDWLVVWLDTETRKTHFIVNDKVKLEKMYEYYKRRIWVGYNIRGYDQWIAKAILADFNPYAISEWIIVHGGRGYEFSNLLNGFPILLYDTSYAFRSLKELEAFMGHSIVETSVPFDIDRKLTNLELKETVEYCKNDVMETFKVFIETKSEFESHIGLITEFKLPITAISKTKTQISATILGAVKKNYKDEFDISFVDTIELGKYNYIKRWYDDWSKNKKDYSINLKTNVGGVPHVYAFGGIHGAKKHYFGNGIFLFADVSSFYPGLMIEYNFLSRSVFNPSKFVSLRDERLKLKALGDPKEAPRKIVINGTFGGLKDKYNQLYDPLMSNNVCINGQLILTDLIDKLDGKAELIQSNTDGILLKLYDERDWDEIVDVCNEWATRVRMSLDFDKVKSVYQKDVNNYLMEFENGKVKAKGSYVKDLHLLDNNLPIVNNAIREYFLSGTPVEKTIMESNKLIDFQIVTKVGNKYKYAIHNGRILNEKVIRCFASNDASDGTIYKQHKDKTTPDKTAGTPDNAFIDNGYILGKKVSNKINKQWYVDLANSRINDFLGKEGCNG